MELIPRFFSDPGQSFFLFGPRGTGKSTWIRQTFPGALFVDLLEPDTFRSYSARPERLMEVLDARPALRIIVIDEIQKLPQLLGLVHLIMEQRKDLRFILTGSSARKLKRSGVDLLAGRAIVKSMHAFMAAELGPRFDLDQAIGTGLIPLVVMSGNPEETLKSYVGLYLKEEVQAEGIVRNIGNFSRFLETMAFSHGCVLNIADIARESQVGRKTVEGYLSVLEDLLLGFRVNVFTKRAKRHLSSHPKFYFFDSGLFVSLRPSGPLDTPQEIEGAALEGLIAQHLRAWIAYRGERADIFFWRTKSGNEVDFVLYGDSVFYAIEVKNSRNVHSKMLKGLVEFKKDYPEAGCLLCYRGKGRMRIRDILCIPVNEFLESLHPAKEFEVVFEPRICKNL